VVDRFFLFFRLSTCLCAFFLQSFCAVSRLFDIYHTCVIFFSTGGKGRGGAREKRMEEELLNIYLILVVGKEIYLCSKKKKKKEKG